MLIPGLWVCSLFVQKPAGSFDKLWQHLNADVTTCWTQANQSAHVQAQQKFESTDSVGVQSL